MKKKKKDKSALHVSGGTDQPEQVNTDAVSRLRSIKKKKIDPAEYFNAIRDGNRSILSQAITLTESSLSAHQELAQQVIDLCLPYSGTAFRIGITGVPGVGKSTFIESFGSHLVSIGKKIAVLAIDPSSERSKGSILGDKTRMELLATNENAYIRPSPSGGSLGGVARKTRETIILCEAAGYDVIIIETVGVGQSETAVHSMVDFFLLLMLAGAGDELQGMKRGIMEMADLIAINKADGENIPKANLAKKEFENALHLFPVPPSGWPPKVLTCSAMKNNGIAKIWEAMTDYKKNVIQNDFFFTRRNEQARYWMHEWIHEELKRNFYSNDNIHKQMTILENEVLMNKISSFTAAKELLKSYFNSKNK